MLPPEASGVDEMGEDTSVRDELVRFAGQASDAFVKPQG
jgi:hypothetical protein